MTDDEKPMSAEERTQRAIRFWRETCCIKEIPSVDVLESYAEAALRDHAAEAVAAERERCAGRFHKDQVEVWTSEIVEHLINFNDPQDYEEVLQLHKGVQDELYKIRDIVSARTEGESQ